MYIDIIVKKKNATLFFVKKHKYIFNIYSGSCFFFGPAPAPGFFINRLRLQGVKKNRLLPASAPASQPWKNLNPNLVPENLNRYLALEILNPRLRLPL